MLVQRRGEIVIPIDFRRRLGLGRGAVMSVEQAGSALVLRKIATRDQAEEDERERADPAWGSDLFAVHRLLGEGGRYPDELRDELGWSAGRIYSALLELVIRGVARRSGDGRYVAVQPALPGGGRSGTVAV